LFTDIGDRTAPDISLKVESLDLSDNAGQPRAGKEIEKTTPVSIMSVYLQASYSG